MWLKLSSGRGFRHNFNARIVRKEHTTPTTFHRRKLPENLIALSSPAGRTMFKESLLRGDVECFFPLSEQFITQSEPSYCSLSSLGTIYLVFNEYAYYNKYIAMVLNALNHDPQRTWKVYFPCCITHQYISYFKCRGCGVGYLKKRFCVIARSYAYTQPTKYVQKVWTFRILRP